MENKIAMKTKAETRERQLIMYRDFQVPAELLFDIWSECKHLKHWWGPQDWPMEECTIDFREGGEWRYCLRGPDKGDESWGKAIYRKISRPDRIAYNDHFTDAKGSILEDMPGLEITVDFTAQGSMTRQTLTVQFNTNEDRDKIMEMGMAQGMDSSLDRMEAYLAEISPS
jgi:uncharacterized protein YndB with AHSA1/START domain